MPDPNFNPPQQLRPAWLDALMSPAKPVPGPPGPMGLSGGGGRVADPTPGWEKIQVQTAATSASLTFSLPGGYSNFLFEVVNIVPVTDNVQFQCRYSQNGGVSFDSGANYWWHFVYSNFSGTSGGSGATAQTQIQLGGAVSNAAGKGICASFWLPQPSSTGYAFLHGTSEILQTGGNGYCATLGTQYVGVGPISAVQFFMSSGNISAGSITLYGLKA